MTLPSRKMAVFETATDAVLVGEKNWAPRSNALALQDRSQWLDVILGANADALVLFDQQLRILLFNRAAEQMFGRTAGEMNGQSIGRLMPDNVRGQDVAFLRGLLADAASPRSAAENRESIGQHADGRCFPISMSVFPCIGKGAMVALMTIRDISERKRYEASLRLAEQNAAWAEERLRMLSRAVEQNPAAIIVTDARGTIEYVNPGFVKTTGYSSDEAIGQNPRFLRSGIHPPDFYSQMWQTLTKGDVWRDRICNRKKNGDLFWEDITISPVCDAQNTITHYVAVKIDITVAMQAEKALAASEQRYRQLAENMRDVVWILDMNMKRTYVSSSVKWLTGHSVEEAMKMGIDEALTASSARRTRKLLSNILAEARTNPHVLRQPVCLEMDYRRKDGGTAAVEVNMSWLLGDDGAPIGAMGVSRDVSARKRTARTLAKYARKLEQVNRELAKATEDARAANRAKDQFLASMSHELRTPLNGVIGMAELLRDTPLDERQRSFVECCHTSGKLLLALINDILDFSKIEAGKMELHEQAFCLSSLIGETIATMDPPAKTKGLKLASDVAANLPKWVRGDDVRLRQILVNLLGNAIKFTEEGQVSLKISLNQLGHAAIGRFVVADTGIGISHDRINRLFRSFSQADSSTTRKYGGTGLGLAISGRLVKLMGGEIGVTSQPGKGSTFWFEIPIHAVAEPKGDEVPSTAAERRLDLPTLLEGRQILLAEDNSINRMFVEEILRRAGAECCAVGNGREVIDAVERRHFDLVLMDCQMPEVDGFIATRQIREMEASGRLSGHLPVIALTANAIQGDRERCLQAGMDNHIGKPCEPKALLGMIDETLAPKDSARDNSPAQPQPQTHVENAPPIDCDALVARCLGNLEFVQKMLTDFESYLPERIETIVQLLQQREATGVAELAHGLKGTAGIMTATSMQSLAGSIEAAAETGNLTDATHFAKQLSDETASLLAYIPQVMARIKNSENKSALAPSTETIT
ncbi:MAG: PAS domain S-box protein [Thermoguttaceae bacterium]